jgi:DNA-binding XRE family transcriptional regulator
MPKSMVPFLRRAEKRADPDAIRRAREAAGLTQEQLAELNGVLPLEVAAWESGAVFVSRYQGELIHWTMENAAHEQRVAAQDLPACPWMAQREAEFDFLRKRSPGRAGWVARAIAAHQADCGACTRLVRELPAAPELPRMPGLLNAIDHGISRLPRWLQLPARAVRGGLFGGAAFCASAVLGTWFGGAEPIQLSAAVFLWTTLGAGWLTLTHGLLRPLADRSPYLAGQLWSAALMLPAAFAFGMKDDRYWLYSPGLWVMAAIFSGLIGLVLGDALDPDGHFLQAKS